MSGLFRLIFSGILLFVLFTLGAPLVECLFSYSWSTTTATVSQSRIVEAGKTKHGHRRYVVEVEFNFEWQGKVYTGNRYDCFGAFGKISTLYEDAAQSFKNQHGEGTKVQVFYNPDSPTTAVLSRGISGYRFFALFIAIFCFALLIATIYGQPVRAGYRRPLGR